MNDYKRLTIENESKFCRHKKDGVTYWQVVERLAELEDMIEKRELLTKEEHLKLCNEFYEQGKFDVKAEELSRKGIEYGVDVKEDEE